MLMDPADTYLNIIPNMNLHLCWENSGGFTHQTSPPFLIPAFHLFLSFSSIPGLNPHLSKRKVSLTRPLINLSVPLRGSCRSVCVWGALHRFLKL